MKGRDMDGFVEVWTILRTLTNSENIISFVNKISISETITLLGTSELVLIDQKFPSKINYYI